MCCGLEVGGESVNENKRGIVGTMVYLLFVYTRSRLLALKRAVPCFYMHPIRQQHNNDYSNRLCGNSHEFLASAWKIAEKYLSPSKYP